jgi:phosphoglycolate phosphatase
VHDIIARRYKLIVFDWDGTLADSAAIIAEAIQAACREIGQPVPDDVTARYVIGLGPGSAARHAAPGLAPEAYPALSAAYRKHYLARESEVSLFDGTREMLSELALQGYLLAIATGKSRAGLDQALARSGLTGFFDGTRCADEDFPKPHPAMLQTLMSKLQSAPDRTLMIGDTTHDVELARNAGAHALAVSYGAHDPALLLSCGPLETVHSIAELRQWLRMRG